MDSGMPLVLGMGRSYEKHDESDESILNTGFGVLGLVRNRRTFGSSETFSFGYDAE